MLKFYSLTSISILAAWPRVKAELAEWDKISFKEWMEDINGWDLQVTH